MIANFIKANIILALLLAGMPASAWQSFYITNTIAGGVLIQGFPTNYPANNGGVSTGTGNGKNVRLHQYAGFIFQGNSTSTTTGSVILTMVRAMGTNNPPLVNLPGDSATNSDYETTASLTLTIPIPIGTNTPITWMTNLDSWYIFPADYVGCYSITNTTSGVVNNAQAGIKAFIPAVLLDGGI